MTYHLRSTNSAARIDTSSFAYAEALMDLANIPWKLWAENETCCWVIASSKSREEWERWRKCK